MAALAGRSFPRMAPEIYLNSRKAIIPPATGEMNQEATIWPILAQLTACHPAATTPKPATAPTMEWVVETGIPYMVEKWSQKAADSRAADMPITRMMAAS